MLVLIFILLIANTISGPFATAACALECSVTLATGPGYVVCMTLCITLEAPLLCFSEKTLIVTRTGTK